MTLCGRAYQAGRPDPIVDDPMAIELVESIDFDFENSDAKVRR
jgi:O-methyltransferase involved in polyketide biosynthesis